MAGLHPRITFAVVALLLALGAPARAELRINDLDVYLNDYEVTVHVVALGAIPAAFHESIQTGIPAHVRFTVELWQYNGLWRDRRLTRQVVERQLTYNVVTKEYRVASIKGDSRPVYTTKDLRDAQRVVSEARVMKLTSASALDPSDVIYVRVRAETALNGENTLLARMAGTAEQTVRQSDYRTIFRVQ
ncbi:MAG: DUF4390 domain-containing protein [Candidatus Rokubacteria bacterium]|nr:DUF4390 domain-containing protein [Candidatus Rokubacteria bacterium]